MGKTPRAFYRVDGKQPKSERNGHHMWQNLTGLIGPMLAASTEPEYTGFFSIEFWSLLFTWINLLILVLLMKRFLYKPVKKMLEDRKKEVEQTYQEADEAKQNAVLMQQEYEEHLKNAKEEANELVRAATRKAQLRGEEIVAEAQAKSAGMIKRAEEQIENEKKQAVNEIKNEISDMALLAAEKIVSKELDKAEHERLIEEFIDSTDQL